LDAARPHPRPLHRPAFRGRLRSTGCSSRMTSSPRRTFAARRLWRHPHPSRLPAPAARGRTRRRRASTAAPRQSTTSARRAVRAGRGMLLVRVRAGCWYVGRHSV
jgi:hypothetical protein